MQEFSLYFEEGWQHIADLGGYDHILFIMALCAVYLMKDWKKVLILVTAFTLGHSITLALSVLGIVRVDTGLIEFLIPVTIVLTALGNVIRGGKEPERANWNYFFAIFFGLIHGLGFSNYLHSLLGSQADILQPLLSFNLGLEFGQLIIVTIVLILSQLIIRIGRASRRDWTLFLSAAIFGVAFVMSIERFALILENK